MEPERPEHEAHIRHPLYESADGPHRGRSWCGEVVSCQFAFVGLDHALANHLNRGRLVPCPKCVRAARRAWQEVEPVVTVDGSYPPLEVACPTCFGSRFDPAVARYHARRVET